MHWKTFVSALLFGTAALPGLAMADSSSPWSFTGEVLYMWRHDTDSPAITVQDALIAPGEKLFKFDDLQNDGAWGGALRADYRIGALQTLGDYLVDKPTAFAYVCCIGERKLCHVGFERCTLSR